MFFPSEELFLRLWALSTFAYCLLVHGVDYGNVVTVLIKMKRYQKEPEPQRLTGKLYRRFYETLVFLDVLESVRGPHNQPPKDSNNSRIELQRSFIRAIAIVCDFEKGGDTVTAAALQNTPALWSFGLQRIAPSRARPLLSFESF